MDLVFCLWALNYGHPLRPSSGSIDGSLIGYLLQSLGLLYVSTILAIVNRNTPPENKVTWLLIAVIPVFGSLFIPHVWRATFIQKGNDPAEKYGVHEVSRGQ